MRPVCPSSCYSETTGNRPRKQGETFRLRKGKLIAECELWSHSLGWELRLVVGKEFIQTAVCKSQDEVLSTAENWKAATTGMLRVWALAASSSSTVRPVEPGQHQIEHDDVGVERFQTLERLETVRLHLRRSVPAHPQTLSVEAPEGRHRPPR